MASHYSGEVPAIDVTTLAAFSRTDRPTILSDHNALVALVAADDEPALSQRAGRIAHALHAHRRHIPASGRRRLRNDIATVWSAVETVAAGRHELTEDDIVRLTVALTHGEVRAACLGRSRDEHTAAAEELWRRLTQAVPAPYRAEPAVLLAFAAYLRGDGGLAGVALDIARQAQPDHRVAKLLRRSLDVGLSPRQLAPIVMAIAAEAERMSTTDDAG